MHCPISASHDLSQKPLIVIFRSFLLRTLTIQLSYSLLPSSPSLLICLILPTGGFLLTIVFQRHPELSYILESVILRLAHTYFADLYMVHVGPFSSTILPHHADGPITLYLVHLSNRILLLILGSTFRFSVRAQ